MTFDLMVDYDRNRTELEPGWQELKPAARAAWDRVDRNWQVNQ